LSIRVLDYAQTSFIDSLDCAIWEDAFLTSISKQALDRAIWKVDLFVSVWEMLLDLFILELENL
jgi:hypothetical protein